MAIAALLKKVLANKNKPSSAQSATNARANLPVAGGEFVHEEIKRIRKAAWRPLRQAAIAIGLSEARRRCETKTTQGRHRVGKRPAKMRCGKAKRVGITPRVAHPLAGKKYAP